MAQVPHDPGVLVSELAGDPDVVELVEEFVRELPDRVSAIRQAVAGHEVATITMLAHRLKGAAGSYGFPAITEAAQQLEILAAASSTLEKISAQVDELASLCGRARATLDKAISA